MAYHLTPEVFSSLPSQEVGRWKARLDRVQTAVEESPKIIMFSGDRDIMIHGLAKQPNDEAMRQDSGYEKAVLSHVYDGLTYDGVIGIDNQPPEYAVGDTMQMRQWELREETAFAAYQRLGLLALDGPEATEFTPPPAAMAALSLREMRGVRPALQRLVGGVEDIETHANLLKGVLPQTSYHGVLYEPNGVAKWWERLDSDLSLIDAVHDGIVSGNL